MPEKVLAVRNFPLPKGVENVLSFLGLCGYYRSFIKDFAARASPLNKLLKKDIPFHWDTTQENSFCDLKEALTSAPVLGFPNYERPFALYTDASGLDLGAFFIQTTDSNKNQVIAFASCTLTPAEANYSVTHQETLAIIWSLKHFRDIIFGYPIMLFTDHLL